MSRAAECFIAVVLVAALGVGASACASSSPSATADPPAQTASTVPGTVPAPVVDRKPGHTSWSETFVDTSRRTVPANGGVAPSRTLVTAIYRPNGNGPFPLILFSHGLAGHPEKFTKLLSAWADAGFAVAAPAFPLTNSHVEGSSANVADVAQQAPDASFVLDNVLALDRQPESRLFEALDESKIGAAGLSLGGLTTYMLSYGECCRDPRITSVAVLDGWRGNVLLDAHAPILVAHSDTDPVVPYSSARDAYDAAKAPAWFVTLHGASHASQWEDDVTPYDQIAERVTTDFWDGTLNGNQQAFTRLVQDATKPDLSSVEAKR